MAQMEGFDFFCDEVFSGKKSVKKVYESDLVLVFYHTKPMYKTHIVFVSKRHVHDLTSLDNNTFNEVLHIAKSLFSKIDLKKYGGRLVTNLGHFQDTPHLHFHFISDGDYPDLKL